MESEIIKTMLNKTFLIREWDIHRTINLDGGGSTGMKFGSEVIKDQGRKLSDIVYFK